MKKTKKGRRFIGFVKRAGLSVLAIGLLTSCGEEPGEWVNEGVLETQESTSDFRAFTSEKEVPFAISGRKNVSTDAIWDKEKETMNIIFDDSIYAGGVGTTAFRVKKKNAAALEARIIQVKPNSSFASRLLLSAYFKTFVAKKDGKNIVVTFKSAYAFEEVLRMVSMGISEVERHALYEKYILTLLDTSHGDLKNLDVSLGQELSETQDQCAPDGPAVTGSFQNDDGNQLFDDSEDWDVLWCVKIVASLIK